MAIRRLPTTNHADVLDRVLDKGVVIDACVRISVAGLEVIGIDANVIVASLPTYLRLCETLATTTNEATTPPPLRAKPSPAEPADLTLLPAKAADPTSPPAEPTGLAPRRAPARRRPRVQQRARANRRCELVVQRCAQGCSFTRPARGALRSVRCPYDGGRVCELSAA